VKLEFYTQEQPKPNLKATHYTFSLTHVLQND